MSGRHEYSCRHDSLGFHFKVIFTLGQSTLANDVCSVEGDAVIATTSTVNQTAENLTITIEISNQATPIDTGFMFEYRPNPNVTDIQPRNHVIGYALTV